MKWPESWPQWRPQPAAEDPTRGGMTQLAAYEAGLTDDPGCWVQPIKVYWTPRLDPSSPEYDPQLAAEVAWEEPGPGDELDTEWRQPDTGPRHGPEPDAEPELPF